MDSNCIISLSDLLSKPEYDFLKVSNIREAERGFDFLGTHNWDSPYNNGNIQCKYVDDDEFFVEMAVRQNFLIMSLNIQSLPSKHSELVDFIKICTKNKCKPDIICLQELWTITCSSVLDIPGYHSLVYRSRVKTQGGGVGFYISSDISYSILPTSIFHERIFETLLIEVTMEKKQPMILGSIYRPGSDSNLTAQEQYDIFLDYLNNILSNESYHKILLAGDVNLDTLRLGTCKMASNYIDCLTANGFLQIITRPTRHTSTSATCIDHLVTNIEQDMYETYIITNRLSDHFPVFFIMGKKGKKVQHKTVITKDFSQKKITSFQEILSNINWAHVIEANEPEQALETFHETFFPLYNSFFPTQKIRFNKNIHAKEKWMTVGLLKSRETKNTLMKKSIKIPTSYNIETYKAYRNIYNRVIRKSKQLYYQRELDANKSNLKKSWKVLNEVLNRNTVKNCTIHLKNGEDTIKEPKELADCFNKFFTSIASNIATKINPVLMEPCNTGSPDIALNFQMSDVPIQRQEFIEAVNNFPSKMSWDTNDLSMSFIKAIATYLSEPLLHIFNCSLSAGVVPNKFKIAKVVPIFKSGEHLDVNNYRPISLLSNFSKIFEKIIHGRLTKYLDSNNIISEYQFGFRKGHSTIHPLTLLIDRAARALNDKKHLVIIFCDLKKAFDTCDPSILLSKLHSIGIQGTEYNWFKSYLTNRKQYVSIANVRSKMLDIKLGVPQGSVLGPLLFNLYINDLPKSSLFTSLMFADDAALIMEDDNIEKLISSSNVELQKICTFFRMNRLSLNPDKTKYIIMSNSNFVHRGKYSIFINDNNNNYHCEKYIKELSRITPDDKIPAIKYLGVYIDPKLKFDYHLTQISNKISKAIYSLRRSKHLLNSKSLLTLYYSLVHCHLNYANEVWSCVPHSSLNTLVKKQKMALRIITNSKSNAHTEPLFKKHHVLPLIDLIFLNKTTFIQSSLVKTSPIILQNRWMTNDEARVGTGLRSDADVYVPFARTDAISRLPYYSFPKLINVVPREIRMLTTTKFKQRLKTHVMNKLSTEIICNRLFCPTCSRI